MIDWNEDSTFTRDHADFIKNRGACDAVYDFVGLTIRECIEKDPSATLEYAKDLLTPERLDWCAEKESWAALKYTSNLLTPERVDCCAKQVPWAALKYASDLLTPERLNWCAEQEPRAALIYVGKPHVSNWRKNLLDFLKRITYNKIERKGR